MAEGYEEGERGGDAETLNRAIVVRADSGLMISALCAVPIPRGSRFVNHNLCLALCVPKLCARPRPKVLVRDSASPVFSDPSEAHEPRTKQL
jgi:hypothetical protein